MSHSIRVTCPEPLTIWIRDDGDEDTPSTGYGLFRIGTEGLDHLAGNPDHCDAASAWAIEQGLMEEPPEEPDLVQKYRDLYAELDFVDDITGEPLIKEEMVRARKLEIEECDQVLEEKTMDSLRPRTPSSALIRPLEELLH